jgi:hypothetical protein
MREYKCKNKITKEFLENALTEFFGRFSENKGVYNSSYGALKEIHVKISKDRVIEVETKSGSINDVKVDDTIKKYNQFIEKVTGYTAAQRKKMLTKL